MIHGPTGFGKSTLASQWCDLLTSEGVTVAWLTVDNDDNNLVWFLSHLIEAIRAVKPTLATELSDVLEERGDESERYVLTSLINEIHQSGEPMTLVIDDWHVVSENRNDQGAALSTGQRVPHAEGRGHQPKPERGADESHADAGRIGRDRFRRNAVRHRRVRALPGRGCAGCGSITVISRTSPRPPTAGLRRCSSRRCRYGVATTRPN